MGYIYGKRIRFRVGERSDIPQWVTWLNDPEVCAGLSLVYPMGTPNEDNWFENMLKRPLEEQTRVIEVQEKEAWRNIGNCSYFNIDWRCRSAEVGIFIGDKTCWNQGYGQEAMELLLLHGFETMNLYRIWLRVFETNPRAIRCYEKAGFVHEGRYRHGYYQDGKYLDIFLMGVLRPEYELRQK